MKPRPHIRAILIDLSGTLHIGSEAIPGAVNAINQLRQHGVPVRFCSNTSKEGRPELYARLNNMGFEVNRPNVSQDDEEELWTSLGAIGQLASNLGLKRPYYLLSSSAQEDVASFLSNAATPEEIPYDSVIVGLAKDILDYQHINTAFQVLTKEHPSQKKVAGDKSKTSIPLLATHRGPYMRDDEGLLSLGPGPFVAALENAAGVQAQVVGKPTKAFFETVIGSLRFKSGEGAIAIVGDDIETDLGGGARELGLWRVLVRTGKYRPGDENRTGVVPPDEVYDSFATFVNSVLTGSGETKPSKENSVRGLLSRWKRSSGGR